MLTVKLLTIRLTELLRGKQQFNVNYDQTFVSVIKSQMYKALFVLMTHFNLKTD
jgi:hypothetical protein